MLKPRIFQIENNLYLISSFHCNALKGKNVDILMIPTCIFFNESIGFKSQRFFG
jgi:hypothetical protein